MLAMDKIKGSGELLPRLQKILESRSVGVSPIKANNAPVGWVTRGAVYLAKKALWQDQVSTQTEIVTKCIQHGRWICFWIPGKNGGQSAVYRFDPSRLLEKGWKNMRDSEEMINIDIKYGRAITSEELDMDPIHKVEQLSLITDTPKPPKLPAQVNNIITADSPEVAALKSSRQKLGTVMAEYAKKFDIPLWEVKKQVYKKYSVGSRTELSGDELHAEYLSYKTALERDES